MILNKDESFRNNIQLIAIAYQLSPNEYISSIDKVYFYNEFNKFH